MRLTRRPYRGAADLALVAALAAQIPGEPIAIEQPYRLSSWSMERPQHGAIWEDELGRALAFAALQVPFFALDILADPALLAAGLDGEILAWADEQARATAARRGSRLLMALWPDPDDAAAIARLAGHGLELLGWDKIFFTRPLAEPAAPAPPPEGFTLRPLGGAAEVPAYVALHRAAFGTENMTEEWRARTLLQPAYRPELDLVAVAPDGRLAAFAIGWLAPDGRSAAVEPMGVSPDFQRHGLGRALLAELIGRFRAAGAEQAYVVTDDERDPARALYTALGFTEGSVRPGYGRWYEPDDA
jgi:mycothiol synthase